MGYIDTDPRTVIEPVYDYAGEFRNGYAEVSIGESKERIESPVMRRRKGEVNVYLNGVWVFSEEPPYIASNRTMLPLRAVAEALGFGVKWYPSERKFEMQNKERILRLAIGSAEASVNAFDDGAPAAAVPLDAAPEIRAGRTYVPLRFIAENAGYAVEWDAGARAVYITTS